MRHRNRSIVFAFLGSLIWLLGVSIWATGSQTDIVATGFDNTSNPPGLSSAIIKCSAIVSPNARPKHALPNLAKQPVGKKALAFEHAPCASTHRVGQILLGVDLLTFALVVCGLIFWWRRRRSSYALA